MRYLPRLTDSSRVHQGEEAQQIATLIANFVLFSCHGHLPHPSTGLIAIVSAQVDAAYALFH